MDRRTFLRRPSTSASRIRGNSTSPVATTLGVPQWRKGSGESEDSLPNAGTLAPYVPSVDKPWNTQRAAHLFRRIGFGANQAELAAALTSTPAAIVTALLGNYIPPTTEPGTWVSQKPFTNVGNPEVAQYYSWSRDIQEWWIKLMLEPSRSLRERMVLFWHNHFVSDYVTVLVTQYMLLQNKLYRENAFGSFKALAKKVTVDPAMLIYLDGATSRAGNPNENYGRELLELFTLGAGAYATDAPHYTEDDIKQLAKALTGWTLNSQAAANAYTEFKSARFDGGNKTIFGVTKNWGIEGKTADDVIDHIFSQVDPDHNRPRAAIYICSKLYQYFVYDVPDMPIVEAMADTLVANDWSIGAVLAELLVSEHFFDDNVIGAKIKSPIDFTLNAIRHFELAAPMDRSKSNVSLPETHDPITVGAYLSQTILWPPNVKGWIGGHSWISGATMPPRIRYAKLWIEPFGSPLPYNFNPVAWIKKFPDYDKPGKLVDAMIAHLLPFGLSAETRGNILLELIPSGKEYDWNPDDPTAAVKIRSALLRITGLGEYQLL